jgi:signal transduction histidine kinase/ligand-binding sensor domain-containing protein
MDLAVYRKRVRTAPPRWPFRYGLVIAILQVSISKSIAMGRRIRGFSIILLALLLCAPAFCIDRDRQIGQLYHTAWTAKDGAPDKIQALAQTTDGYLWLGTDKGLFRFDGLNFERFAPHSGPGLPRNNVISLLAIPDGGLWVGLQFGGISLVKNDRVTNYGEQDGLPAGTVRSIARDRRGVIWVVTRNGVAQLKGSHWSSIGPDRNVPTNCYTAYVDRGGTLWVGAADRVVFLPDGGTTFQLAADHLTEVRRFAEASDGALWMAETARSVRPVPVSRRSTTYAQAEVRVGSVAILIDDRGSLWIPTIGDGIRRVPYPDRLNGLKISEFGPEAEIFTVKDGLTSDYAECILQDREGNVWIGTNGGLDRFRQSAVVPVSLPVGSTSFTLTAVHRGAVMVSSANRPLMQILDGKVSTAPIVTPRESISAVLSTYQNSKGDLWIAAMHKLLQYSNGKLRSIATLSNYAEGMTEDRSGALWVSIVGQGVERFDDGRWVSLKALGGPAGEAHSELTDAEGRVWFGFSDNTITVMDGQKFQNYSSRDDITVGDVSSLCGSHSFVWIGGSTGLEFYDGRQFRAILPADGGTFNAVSAILAPDGDGLWLSEARGIIHIPEPEMMRLRESVGYKPNYRVFDFLDGLSAPLQGSFPSPSAVQATDGILWFATHENLVWIDPRKIPTNPVPPSVFVKSIIANGKDYTPTSPLRLPSRIGNLQISFTAISLSIPERVRFRYLLEGQDTNWTDAGIRRAAFYTNLDPGSYSFHVIACNDAGVWNRTGATLNFVIAPAFYQAFWFKGLLVVMVAGAVWLFYLTRLRQATAQIKARLGERLEERERIARELHDTLIQSVDGLMLRLQTALNEPDRDRSRQMIEKALDSADEVMLEGRQRVQSLRFEALTISELSEALASYGDQLSRDHGIPFSVSLIGIPKTLDPFLRDEVYRIGREALLNAFHHSDATKIELEITYDRTITHLRIRDNGGGIDQQILNGGRPGHWGLSGMRERAQEIGCPLVIWSRPGAGTEVDLAIPIRTPHLNRLRTHCLRWIQRVAGGVKE